MTKPKNFLVPNDEEYDELIEAERLVICAKKHVLNLVKKFPCLHKIAEELALEIGTLINAYDSRKLYMSRAQRRREQWQMVKEQAEKLAAVFSKDFDASNFAQKCLWVGEASGSLLAENKTTLNEISYDDLREIAKELDTNG